MKSRLQRSAMPKDRRSSKLEAGNSKSPRRVMGADFPVCELSTNDMSRRTLGVAKKGRDRALLRRQDQPDQRLAHRLQLASVSSVQGTRPSPFSNYFLSPYLLRLCCKSLLFIYSLCQISDPSVVPCTKIAPQQRSTGCEIYPAPTLPAGLMHVRRQLSWELYPTDVLEMTERILCMLLHKLLINAEWQLQGLHPTEVLEQQPKYAVGSLLLSH